MFNPRGADVADPVSVRTRVPLSPRHHRNPVVSCDPDVCTSLCASSRWVSLSESDRSMSAVTYAGDCHAGITCHPRGGSVGIREHCQNYATPLSSSGLWRLPVFLPAALYHVCGWTRYESVSSVASAFPSGWRLTGPVDRSMLRQRFARVT